MEIKAFIFDYSGVFTTPEQWEVTSQLDQAHWQSFIENRGAELGIRPVDIENGVKQWGINRQIIMLVALLKKEYKVAILTSLKYELVKNAVDAARIDDLFNMIIGGAMKTDGEVYKNTATDLSMFPEECMLIDDSMANVATAQGMAMHGIQYKGLESLLQSLAAQGFIEFYNPPTQLPQPPMPNPLRPNPF